MRGICGFRMGRNRSRTGMGAGLQSLRTSTSLDRADPFRIGNSAGALLPVLV